jgi:Sec-independent protein secretion pathway component TatC
MASENIVRVPIIKVMKLLVRMHGGGAVFLLSLAPFSQSLYTKLYGPFLAVLPKNTKLVFVRPTGAAEMYFILVLSVATIVGSPWVLYQLWRFVRADLTGLERKCLRWFLVAFAIITGAGAVGAYYIVLRSYTAVAAVSTGSYSPMLDISQYTLQINAHIFLTVTILDLTILTLFSVLLLTFLRRRAKPAGAGAGAAHSQSLAPVEVLCLTWGGGAILGVAFGLPPNVLVATFGLLIGMVTLRFCSSGRRWPAIIGSALSFCAVVGSFLSASQAFL